MTQLNKSEFFSILDNLGKNEVSSRIATGVWTKDSGRLPLAEEWLRRERYKKESESMQRAEAREEEYNSSVQAVRVAR